MATIEKRESKSGTVYRITIASGIDSTGKQIRHRRTWKPAPGLTERKTQEALARAVADFEREIEQGYNTDDNQTFDQYAAYVLGIKETSGKKLRTIESYRDLLKRISPVIGHKKLKDIRPQHLNKFYADLMQPGQRITAGKAKPKPELNEKVKSRSKSHKDFGKLAGLSAATIDAACRGETVSEATAKKIAAALDAKPESLFTIYQDLRPLSGKTVLECHRVIHLVLQQAEKEMLVPYNAADKATPPQVTHKEVNYFQPSQVHAILKALETEPLKWQVITHLLIVTGCRRGEIAGLKWSKINLDAGTVRIDSALNYSRTRGIFENATKTADVRKLRIPTETVELLRTYQTWWDNLKEKLGDLWPGYDYLFLQDNGKPIDPNSITQWFAGFSARHNLPHINPHAFRHTAASAMTQNKLDPVTVSKRLGHTRVSTTMDIYAHMFDDADEEACETIADALIR